MTVIYAGRLMLPSFKDAVPPIDYPRDGLIPPSAYPPLALSSVDH